MSNLSDTTDTTTSTSSSSSGSSSTHTTISPIVVQSRGLLTQDDESSTTSISINPDGTTTSLHDHCNYTDEIRIGHPSSTSVKDQFYLNSIAMYEAAILTIDQINSPQRCGVHLSSGNYSLRLLTYSDDSDPSKTQAIGRYMASASTSASSSPSNSNSSSSTKPKQKKKKIHFWTAGYSSKLTQHLASVAEETSNLLLAAGASQTSIFVNKTMVYGTYPTDKNRFHWAFYATTIKGARSVAFVQEEGATTLCDNIPAYATKFRMDFKGHIGLRQEWNSLADYALAAQTMKEWNPDVVITCSSQPKSCAHWIAGMRQAKWQPKAQIFSSCGVGSIQLEDAIPTPPQAYKTDLQYMMGVNLWDKAMAPLPDPITSWTPRQFASLLEQTTFRNASSPSPSQSAAISILVQAMERADSYTDLEKIKEILSRQTFQTVFGQVAFDDNGQGKVPSLLLQYDSQQSLQVLFPRDRRSSSVQNNGNDDFVYPLPTWDQRDCQLLGDCVREHNGTCLRNGSCVCPSHLISFPNYRGINATCKEHIPVEDMGYIDGTIIATGYAMMTIQLLLSGFFLGWTWKYRQQTIVRLSQPIFLAAIAVGAFVMALSILPMSAQTGYRPMEEDDEDDDVDEDIATTDDAMQSAFRSFNARTAAQVVDDDNNNSDANENNTIQLVDASCMAWLWLVALGFAMIYAGLFAKIWRVKMIMESAVMLQRRLITAKDVVSIMVVILLLESIILFTWQLVAPLRWEREVVLEDEDGYPLQSVGRCQSDNSLAFGLALAVLNGGCLVYALVLAYTTRNIPTQLSEGTWIALSVGSTFQILLLSIPTLVIAHDDTNASFFVRSTIVFLVSSTSTLLIFGPKFYRLHFAKADQPTEEVGGGTVSRGGTMRRTYISGLDLGNTTTGSQSRISTISRYSSANLTTSYNGNESAEFSVHSGSAHRRRSTLRRTNSTTSLPGRDSCSAGDYTSTATVTTSITAASVPLSPQQQQEQEQRPTSAQATPIDCQTSDQEPDITIRLTRNEHEQSAETDELPPPPPMFREQSNEGVFPPLHEMSGEDDDDDDDDSESSQTITPSLAGSCQ